MSDEPFIMANGRKSWAIKRYPRLMAAEEEKKRKMRLSNYDKMKGVKK